ncbi:MAG: hypothetical protein M4579_007290 [Chaenotheca gracillima]|nr:MAG: hypothetical protein M4579_007290 [Chaenotheca gracillima]
MSWDVLTASEEWLVDFVHRTEAEHGMVGGLREGNRVIKLSDTIAVKYGYSVSIEEAATQDFAHQNVKSSIVRIPKVYRYLVAGTEPRRNKGYLFMEYVPGRTIDALDLSIHEDIVPRIAKIIEHLGQILGDGIPGPVGGGEPQGYLWGDDGADAIFGSVEELNAWLNKRLALRDKSIDVTPYPLVLCHMDLCRRNMILDEETNAIWLLDWGFAGFYPRFFEIYTLRWSPPYDPSYKEPLITATEELLKVTDEERRLKPLMQIARAAQLRYFQ